MYNHIEKDEKKLTDEMEDILIEFDEYGFAPTITMPYTDAEEYAIAWRNTLRDLFERLCFMDNEQKAEIHRLQEEIERLTEELRSKTKEFEITEKAFIKNVDENIELIKQVDKLKASNEHLESENTRLICEMSKMLDNGWDIMDKEAENCYNKGFQQAVKDCYEIFKFYRKEYYDIPLDLVARDIKEKTGVDVE